ncbi:putative efflux protein [Acetobacter malorum]|uniref:Bcr/CflA family efflux transporter n=1 Tax=Acetobacter malorum TaxID=178901 RepID=A0A177GCB3_9PROT|nr:putative efflux protein [Acetobacter malorum]
MPRFSPAAFVPGTGFTPWLIVLLGLVTAIGPVATDMYLPAFPEVEQDLGGGKGSAQFTLAAWFLGLALGQFSQGPLSDRFGRRMPLMLGLLIFAIASAGCAIVQDYHLFCVCRFVAAVGGSASAVIPRAIVRDVATGKKGAKLMSQLTLVFGVMPVLAPSFGSLVLQFGNWRWIFWIGTLYALAAIVGLFFSLPDTLRPERRVALSPVKILARYITISQEPLFLSNALIATFSTFVMFAYLGSAPVLFEQVLHFTPGQFGAFFGVNAAAFILGTQINGRLVHRVAMPVLLETGLFWALAGCRGTVYSAGSDRHCRRTSRSSDLCVDCQHYRSVGLYWAECYGDVLLPSRPARWQRIGSAGNHAVRNWFSE